MKDIPVTSLLLRAFELYKDEEMIRSDRAMCRTLNIPVTTYSNWKLGKSLAVNGDIWEQIEESIKPYLNKAKQEIQHNFINKVKEGKVSLQNPSHTVYFLCDTQEEHNLIVETIDKVIEVSGKGCSPGEIMTINDLKPQTLMNFPHLPQKVAAGTGIHQDFEAYGNRPDLALMDVSGESMEPTYSSDEKVVVHLYQEPVVFGNEFLPMHMVKALIPEDSIIVYEKNGDGMAMKRVKYDEGKGTWYFKLTADNTEWAKKTKFTRIIKKTDDFKIIGVVLGKLK